MTTENIIHILPIGLNESEMRVLNSLSQVSSLSSRSRSYVLTEDNRAQSSIYLVNGDDHVSLNTWRTLHNTHPAPTLFLSTRELRIEHHVILRRPVIPARLLSALDDVRFEENIVEEIVITDLTLANQPTLTTLSASSVHTKSPGTRVLVANSSAKIRRQVAISLKPYWVSVDFAENGRDVSQKLTESFYDLIFLDAEFSDVTGFQLCKDIKQSKPLAQTPVIMLDKRPSLYRRMRASISACDTYLPMPISRIEFDDCLNRHLSSIRGVVDPYNSRQTTATLHAA